MNPLTRSMFLLSLAVAPLAAAATPSAALFAFTEVSSATAPEIAPVKSGSLDNAFVQSEVQALETKVDGMREELSDLRARDEARARVIGDPNVHSLWP